MCKRDECAYEIYLFDTDTLQSSDLPLLKRKGSKKPWRKLRAYAIALHLFYWESA